MGKTPERERSVGFQVCGQEENRERRHQSKGRGKAQSLLGSKESRQEVTASRFGLRQFTNGSAANSRRRQEPQAAIAN